MEHPEILPVILVLLTAAVLTVALFRRLNISPVLGYLAAGILIGPSCFSVIHDVDGTRALAEFGVVFLLFVIGLELSFSRLKSMRTQVFGFGTAQVLVTGTALGAMLYLLGHPLPLAIVVGGGLALSSTAMALQVIEESGEKSSQVGRLSLAILLLQDLAVVPLLVLVPLLGDVTHYSIGQALAAALGKAVLVLIVILIAGRVVLQPLFRMVSGQKNTELFTALTLLIVLGTAWVTSQAGLSLALGAFVAGLLVAETKYRHQVEVDILPYKGLFLGLFFMAVGMQLDLKLLMSNLPVILMLAASLMGLKAGIIVLLCRSFRFSLGAALKTGLMLSQGGEFGFVLFGLAAQANIISQQLSQSLMAVIVVSMALTPPAALLGRRLSASLERTARAQTQAIAEELHDLSNHVVLFGYGRVGQTVGKLLDAEGIGYAAIDMNPNIIRIGKEKRQPVYYGDATRTETVRHLGILRARCAVITVNDYDAAERQIRAIRVVAPDIPVIARAHDLKQLLRLENAGANLAVSELFEASIQLGAALLRVLGIADTEITRITQVFRDRDYALARGNADMRIAETRKPMSFAKPRVYFSGAKQ
jgi:CPA2 family monovalent cation:H+ antiporter-2